MSSKRSAVRLLLLVVLTVAAALPSLSGQPAPTFEGLRTQIESAVKAGDYDACIKACDQAEPLAPAVAEHRWVQYRRADAGWRLERERDARGFWMQRVQPQVRILTDLAKLEEQERTGSRLRADVQESLGDAFMASSAGAGSWKQAWDYHREALDYWAGSTDLSTARESYLRILKNVTDPIVASGSAPTAIDNWQLDPLLKSTRGGAELVGNTVAGRRLRYVEALLAIKLDEEEGDVRRAFEGALAGGVEEPWGPPAALAYAQWLLTRTPDEAGTQCRRAEELYRMVLGSEATDRYRTGQAQEGLARLVGNGLRLTVDRTFLPGAKPEYLLSERAGRPVQFSLYRLDLPRQAEMPAAAKGALDFLKALLPARLPLADRWTVPGRASQSCLPQERRGLIEKPVPPGAYLLEARQGDETARELVVVSDLVLVLRRSPHRALVYAARVGDGAPVPGAEFALHALGGLTPWGTRGTTGAGGYALVDLPQGFEKAGLWAVARSGDRQALAATSLEQGTSVRSYAFSDYGLGPQVALLTDRPIYRPGEKVQWKVIVRDGTRQNLPPPVGTEVRYTLYDGRRTVVREGTVVLNAFGSASQDFTLEAGANLGLYQMEVAVLGEETDPQELFRVEEFRLPEFLVTVEPAEEGGGRRRPGAEIAARIRANYLSGGPLSDGEVEVEVREKELWGSWEDPEEYGWFYEEEGGFSREEGGGRTLATQTLHLDAAGTLLFRYRTDELQDDARIEVVARVKDSARRIETGTFAFVVSEKDSVAHIVPGQGFAKPGDRIPIHVYLVDTGGKPAAGRGTLVITRESEVEIWQDPQGKMVQGEDLELLRRDTRDFPPSVERGVRPWKRLQKEIRSKEVLRRDLAVGPGGTAAVEFAPAETGYYDLSWRRDGDAKSGDDEGAALRVVGETFWGLHSETPRSLELRLDREVVAPGGKARALLTLPRRGASVLFFSVGDEIETVRLFSMRGTAALAEVPVNASSEPALALVALTLEPKGSVQTRQKVVSVPPLGRFLDVAVRSEQETLLPGSPSSVKVEVRDAQGKGVRAEVAVAVADEATYLLAGDPSPDLRPTLLRSARGVALDGQDTATWRAFVEPLPPGVTLEQPPITVSRGSVALWGKVIDEQGEPIIGATIQVTGPAMPGFQGAATDINGEYRVPSLPPGKNYQVKVEAQGYGTQIRQGIEITAGNSTSLPFKMASGTTTVTVLGCAPLVDSRKTETGAVLSDTMINDIPLGRNSDGVAYLAPSAVTTGLENSVTVNGVEMTNSGAAERGSLTLTVRHDFRATAAWEPAVMTGEDGKAVVPFTYPQSLTEWRATASAVTATGAGWAKASSRTDQPLTARLEAPRFLVEGDRATVSLVVTNRTEKAQRVRCALRVAGSAALAEKSSAVVEVAAEPERQVRAEWTVLAGRVGEVQLEATAVGATTGDAVRTTREVRERGVLQSIGRAGRVEGDRASMELELPEGADLQRAHLEVTASAGFSGAVLEALPYLADYPYGCTEQTMSRFVPCVVAAQALRDLRTDPAAVAEALSGRKGESLQRLDDMVARGLQRLMGFRHYDGGWGWWEDDDSDDHMTAYVLWGLSLARAAGVKVEDEVFEEGLDYIEGRLKTGLSSEEQAWLLRGAAAAHRALAPQARSTGDGEVGAPSWIEVPLRAAAGKATTSTVFELALLAQAARDAGAVEEAARFSDALLAKAVDDRTGTQAPKAKGRRVRGKVPATGEPLAHWGGGREVWWRWQEDPVSVTALALLALAADHGTTPEVRGAVNWLLARRESGRWSNTWNTSMSVMALCAALRSENAPAAESRWEVLVGGEVRGHFEFALGQSAVQKLSLGAEALREGPNEVRLRRIGGADRITYGASLRYVVTGEPIPPAGFGMLVRRYYDRVGVAPTLLNGLTQRYEEVAEGSPLRAGDLVRCRLFLEVNEDAEYVLLEDLKPAGMEAEEKLSGDEDEVRGLASMPGPNKAPVPTGKFASAYTELRDDRVAFFFANLPAGVWEVTYELRAETPGTFTALPAQAQAMYAPHIRTNSTSATVVVEPEASGK